jgi:hypothetical protein
MCISIKFLRKILFSYFLNLINIWLYLKKKKKKSETLKEFKKKKKKLNPKSNHESHMCDYTG